MYQMECRSPGTSARTKDAVSPSSHSPCRRFQGNATLLCICTYFQRTRCDINVRKRPLSFGKRAHQERAVVPSFLMAVLCCRHGCLSNSVIESQPQVVEGASMRKSPPTFRIPFLFASARLFYFSFLSSSYHIP